MNNVNNDMLENLKQIMGEKQVNDAISQISPEMIKNFSDLMKDNNSNSTPVFDKDSDSNFDIDMDTMLKMKSIIDKLNSKKSDPRSNLLNSLKPYMRESRKENIDKYANFLKMADLMTILNNENNKKERNSDE